MNIYYIRTVAEDYPQLIALGKLLGAIIEVDGAIYAPFGQWDYIGPIVKDGSSLKDGQGREYIHANIATPVSLRATAVALAATNPDVAAGLANLSKYFLLDGQGNATAPAIPYRVFAT